MRKVKGVYGKKHHRSLDTQETASLSPEAIGKRDAMEALPSDDPGRVQRRPETSGGGKKKKKKRRSYGVNSGF